MPARRHAPRIAALLLAAGAATASLSACTKDSGSTAEFCTQVQAVPSLETVVTRFSETDPAVLDDRIDRARAAYHDLEDAAPKEIHGDTAEVVAVVDAVLDAVAAHPSDPAKATDALRTEVKRHPKVGAARARVVRYAKAECDVTLDGTLGG
ncbi:MAG: hypothetical protein U0P45_14320 [Acidimicrobiales bacterium]